MKPYKMLVFVQLITGWRNESQSKFLFCPTTEPNAIHTLTQRPDQFRLESWNYWMQVVRVEKGLVCQPAPALAPAVLHVAVVAEGPVSLSSVVVSMLVSERKKHNFRR